MSRQQTPRRTVMPPGDRLDEIRDRYVEWHQDRGDHTPAPDTETWVDADHPDESMEHCIVRNDVPAMLTALRAVLDACSTYEKTQAIYGIEMGQREIIRVVRAEISAALGEGS